MNYAPQFESNLSLYQPGTGRGLIDHEKFQQWLLGSPNVLLCYGHPGAGKTIIATKIIDTVFERRESQAGSAVLYIYCDYKLRNEQSYKELLGSLARQLLSSINSVPQCVSATEEKCKTRNVGPSEREYENIIREMFSIVSTAWVVIDALDECEEQVRNKLVTFLRDCAGQGILRLLVTSRPLPLIQSLFAGDADIQVTATEADIAMYLDSRVQFLPSVVRDDQHLIDEITRAIAKAANGV